MEENIDRRKFLRNVGLAGAAGLMAPSISGLGHLEPFTRWAGAASNKDVEPSWLDKPPAECPVDTVVAMVLENRSFDHMLGWLSTDEKYMEEGKLRYGKQFKIAASNNEEYRNQKGQLVSTFPITAADTDGNPDRICGYTTNPGHGWYTGRLTAKKGFLAPPKNELNALAYYRAEDVSVYAELARRFSVSDHHFCSLMGETMPNRQYFMSATSNGAKDNPPVISPGMWTQPTIFDQLTAANIPCRSYYTDLPISLLYAGAAAENTVSMNRYYEDAAQGTLPAYSVLEPSFEGPNKANAEWPGDINSAQAMIQSVLDALMRSPQWERSLFVLIHDDWGGFYDHVAPTNFPDQRSSKNINEDFGYSGFRTPALVISPWVKRGQVSHQVQDHVAVMRFLQWRFLGAPAQGPGRGRGSKWWLNKRNRYASNLGAVLTATSVDPDPEFDRQRKLPPISPTCFGLPLNINEPTHSPAFRDLLNRSYPPAKQPWLKLA